MSKAFVISEGNSTEVVVTFDKVQEFLKRVLKERRMWVNEPISTTVGGIVLQKSYVVKFTDAEGFVDKYFEDMLRIPFDKGIFIEDGHPTPETVHALYEWAQAYVIFKIQTDGNPGYIEFWHEYMADKSLSQEESEGRVTRGLLG